MTAKKATKSELEEAQDAPQEPAPASREDPFETWLVESEAQLRSKAGAFPDAVQPGLLNAADGLKTALSAVRNFRSLQREPEDPNA